MLKKTVAIIVFVALISYSYTSFSENYIHEQERDIFDKKVGIATLKQEPISEVPATVTVIDRKMIEEYNFSSISSAVETLAGIQVYRTTFKQQIPTVRGVLQDHYANKVLVMINGVPSWHAITGESNLDRISIHDVEHIEVLKGPASVIFGSQAYTGAINIVLRKPKHDDPNPGEFHGQFHAGIGDKDAHSVGVHHYDSSSEDDWSIFAAVNEKRGNRYRNNHTDEAGVDSIINDYQDNLNASVLFEYDDHSDDHSFLINAFRNDEGNYEGITPKFEDGAGNNHDVDGLLVGYTYSHRWNENYLTQVQLFYDLNERNFSRLANDDTRVNVLGYRFGGNFRNLFSISDSFDIEVGASYEHRESQQYRDFQRSTNTILAENNLLDRNVHEYAGYAQADWKPLQGLRMILGSRYTRNENFGGNMSLWGTIGYAINENNMIKFITGQSFRAPSLFESYFITPSQSVFGSETLEPEKADTFELGYQYAKDKFSVQALAYYSIYRDKIYRIKKDIIVDEKNELENVYANGDEFTAKGLEVELKYLNPKFASLFLNFDYVHGDDGDRRLSETEHYNFKYVPEFTASMGISKQFFGDFNVSLIGNYISSTNGPKERIDDSVIVDLNLAYQHKYKKLQLKHVVSIHNISDMFVTFPEYVYRNRNLNEVPLEYERSIFYSLIAHF
jgi:outer membrane cobalamin receptor